MTINVFNLNREQFQAELAERTTPQLVYDHASEVYGFLAGMFKQDCNDSTLREWTFQWASELGGVDYDVIYNKWLND